VTSFLWLAGQNIEELGIVFIKVTRALSSTGKKMDIKLQRKFGYSSLKQDDSFEPFSLFQYLYAFLIMKWYFFI
jgi:hypothetical protein